MKAVTKRLRVLRATRNVTQETVAQRARIVYRRYWQIENGYREPSEAELVRIARVLNVDPSEIVPAPEPAVAS